MRIVAINGSYRGSRGHTAHLIARIFTGARTAGAECEEILLAKQKISRCLACDQCQKREPRFECALDAHDDVRSILQALAAADLVIYATPVYIFGISALLKMFLERFYCTGDVYHMRVSNAGLFFHDVNPAICSKPFVSLICCDNLEDETSRNVREYFRTFSRFMDAPHVGELNRNGGMLCGHGKPSSPSRRLEEIYLAYESAGRELVTNGRIQRSTRRRANQEVVPVPFFHWLKQIRLVPFKQKMLERAKEFRAASRRESS